MEASSVCYLDLFCVYERSLLPQCPIHQRDIYIYTLPAPNNKRNSQYSMSHTIVVKTDRTKLWFDGMWHHQVSILPTQHIPMVHTCMILFIRIAAHTSIHEYIGEGMTILCRLFSDLLNTFCYESWNTFMNMNSFFLSLFLFFAFFSFFLFFVTQLHIAPNFYFYHFAFFFALTYTHRDKFACSFLFLVKHSFNGIHASCVRMSFLNCVMLLMAHIPLLETKNSFIFIKHNNKNRDFCLAHLWSCNNNNNEKGSQRQQKNNNFRILILAQDW